MGKCSSWSLLVLFNAHPNLEPLAVTNVLHHSQVSPGVKQLVKSFNTLVADPSSVYRMAELARTLGERRLCRLEVELMTLTHYVYCVEHEPLQEVLAHITSMVSRVAMFG